MLKKAGHLALVIGLAERLALIVVVLTLTEGNLQLGQPLLVDEKGERDDGFAGVLDGVLPLAHLSLGDEELAVASRLVVIVGAKLIGGDVHALDPQFAVLEEAVRVHQRGLRVTDRLYLGTAEGDTGREALQNLVVERRTLVSYVHITFR